MSRWKRDDIREIDVLSGAFMFLRKKCIEEVGLMEERFFLLAEDIDWCYRIKKKRWKIMFNPESAIIHHSGKSLEQIGITRLRHAIYSNLLYFQMHQGLFAPVIFRILTSLSNVLKSLKWAFMCLTSEEKDKALHNVKAHWDAAVLSLTIQTGFKRHE